MISEFQYNSLLEKSKITNVFGLVVVLFATDKRAFILDIRDIAKLKSMDVKSININKIDSWSIPYIEIPTASSRKTLLDYTGDLVDLVTSK